MRLAAAVCGLALLAGCATPHEDAARMREQAPAAPGQPKKEQQQGGAPQPARRDRAQQMEPAPASSPASEPAEATAPAASGDTGGNAALLPPRAGRYGYAQSGFERFCTGTVCDRSELPEVQTAIVRRAGKRVTIEARPSARSTTETHYVFSHEVVEVTSIEYSTQVQGFDYTETITPDPPVEALRLPLEVGSAWDGAWRGDVSGRYSVAITGREEVSVGARTVDAFVVRTVVEFRGEFEGSSRMTLWLDPEHALVLASRALLDARSSYGEYHSQVATALTSGPGY